MTIEGPDWTNPHPFVRYFLAGQSFRWWSRVGLKILTNHGWKLLDPQTFVRETSYGYDKDVVWSNEETEQYDYSRQKSTAVIEFHGSNYGKSIFFPTSPGDPTVIDDLLIFLSLYSGVYSQYLVKETNDNLAVAPKIGHSNTGLWAATGNQVAAHFQTCLTSVPTLDRDQFELAVRWFLSAISEFELGRPIVEVALNWVSLESQANSLNIGGTNFPKVKTMLANQGFAPIPQLRAFYKLRNDAFHVGQVKALSEQDAQRAREVGRQLVRAQTLVLLGMKHSDFSREFEDTYI